MFFWERNKKSFEENHTDFIPARDDAEAKNDFWSIAGDFIYRHHVEASVKLYMPRDESFLVLSKYIDVTRTTHT